MSARPAKGTVPSFPRLSTLYFYLSSYCNLNCLHCWIAPKYVNNNVAPQEAPFTLLKEIVDQAIPLGLKGIKITGGEPLLSANFFALVDHASKKKLRIAIETNGTLINDSVAKFLKEKNVGRVGVSLDGPNASVHEKIRRQKGCFNKTVAAIRALKKQDLTVLLIMSLYKGNAGHLEKTIAFAASLGVDSFKINCMTCISRGRSLKKKQMTLGVADYIAINKEIDERIQPKYRMNIILDIPPAFKQFKKARQAGMCGLKGILGVLPDGRISICGIGEVASSLILGNVRNHSLRDIWMDDQILRSIRDDLPGKLEGVCRQCVFKGFCMGKCRAEAYYSSGNLFSGFSFCEEARRSGLFPEARAFKVKQEVA
jgi:SynChlorMet cassette radical SAM/SPASM protein ScmF